MTPYTYHIYYNIYYKKPFPSSFFPFPKGLLFHSVPHFGHLVKKKQSLRRKINRTKLFVTNNFLYFCPLKSKDDSMRKKILVLDDKIAIAKVLSIYLASSGRQYTGFNHIGYPYARNAWRRVSGMDKIQSAIQTNSSGHAKQRR